MFRSTLRAALLLSLREDQRHNFQGPCKGTIWGPVDNSTFVKNIQIIFMIQNNANIIKNSKQSIRSHPGPFQTWGPVWLYKAPAQKVGPALNERDST